MNELKRMKQKLTHPLIDLCTNKVKSDIPSLLTYISYMKKTGSLSQIDCLNLTLEELRFLSSTLNSREKQQLKRTTIYLYLEKSTAVLFEEYKELFSDFKIYSVVVNGLVKKFTTEFEDTKIIDARLWYKYLRQLYKLTCGISKCLVNDDFDRDKKMFLILCNRIVRNVTYDLNSEESYNGNHKWHSADATNEIVGLIEGKCVCRGYSGIVRDACDILGIKTIVVYGGNDSCGHAWIQALLDDKWYNADLLWDAENIFKMNDTYWLLKSDDDFNKYGISTNSGIFFHKSFSHNRSPEYKCDSSIEQDTIKKYLYLEDNIKKHGVKNKTHKVKSLIRKKK